MKRNSLVIGLLGATMAFATSVNAQDTFKEGSRMMELTAGVGVIANPGDKLVTFDQHFTMEWGVKTIADKFTLGVGFAVNNSWGGKEGVVAGEYDYKYSTHYSGKVYKYSTGKWESINETKTTRRQGVGTADAKLSRDDINALATVSLHYSPISRLDTYVRIGLGACYMHYITSNIHNESGFKSANVNQYSESDLYQERVVYSFNDLDHVKWYGADDKIGASIAAYVGANYALTDRWGVSAQVGLVSANLKGTKKGASNQYGVFAVGASYNF